MNNILSDFEHVYCVPGYVYPVKVLINLYLWYILNKGLEFHVQFMICFILMQKVLLLCVD